MATGPSIACRSNRSQVADVGTGLSLVRNPSFDALRVSLPDAVHPMEKYPFRSVNAIVPALGPVSTCTRAPEIGKFVVSLTSPTGIVTTEPASWGGEVCNVLGEVGAFRHATDSHAILMSSR